MLSFTQENLTRPDVTEQEAKGIIARRIRNRIKSIVFEMKDAKIQIPKSVDRHLRAVMDDCGKLEKWPQIEGPK